MGGRGSSSMSGRRSGGSTVYEQATAYATASYDKAHPNGPSVSARIPSWVLDKKIDDFWERSEYEEGDGAFIKRQTEKAYLIANNTESGQISFWMPKTWMKTAEQARADSIEFDTRWIVGANYNTYLKQVASDAGIKLGAAKRTAKIQEKLAKNGVRHFSKEEFAGSSGFTVQNSSLYDWESRP